MAGVRIIRKPVVEGLPGSHHVLFFGRINKRTQFVIYNTTVLDEASMPFSPFVAMGPAGCLKEIGRGMMQHYGGKYDYTNVETEKGLFHFPKAKDDFSKSGGKTKPATFKGQPIEVYGGYYVRS
jgi:hypothetical protein